MKKLLSLSLVLALTLSLAAPALAAGPLPTVPVLDKLDVLDDVSLTEPSDVQDDWEAQLEAWKAAHPTEVAAFDADAYFTAQVGDAFTKEQYLALNHLTEEAFQADLLNAWVSEQLYQEQEQAELDAFLVSHPGALDRFDPDAWFAERYDYYGSKEEYMESLSLTEKAFRRAMTMDYIVGIQAQETRAQRIADYEHANPGAYAAFDADAWLAEHYSWYDKESYMDDNDLDEAGFREVMFLEFLGALDQQESHRQAVAAYLSEHPDVLDGFDPMAYLESYGYRDPKTAFMDDHDLETEQDFVEYLQYDYITALQVQEERKDCIAAYEAEHPGAAAGFDAEAYFAENYAYFSKDEFMSTLGLSTDEDFHDYLLCEWIEEQSYDDRWETDFDAEKITLGGVPGELGVMVNGTYLTFTDKKPYAQDGATYVPAEELAAALGQEPQTVTTNGYAPLRASAEAAGYAVYWDADFETAVLLNTDKLVQELDGQFTILNSALEQWARDPEKNYQTSLTMAIDATLFNSIDGDRTYAMSAALEQITSSTGTSATGKYDLSAMKDLLRDALGEELYGYLAEDGEAESLLDLLSKGDFQVRADYETGTIYLTASSFPSLFSIMGKAYPKDVWLSWKSATAAGNADTLGAALSAAALSAAELEGESPVYYYRTAAEYGQMCAAVLGDTGFEKKGGDQVLSLDAQDLIGLLSGLLGEDAYDLAEYMSFKELSLELTVKADGTVTGSFACRPQSVYSALADLRMAGDWTLDGERQDATIECHLKNMFKVTITMESVTKPTGQKPETTPPEQAAVVPMDETTG